jgi:hypothetical protein
MRPGVFAPPSELLFHRRRAKRSAFARSVGFMSVPAFAIATRCSGLTRARAISDNGVSGGQLASFQIEWSRRRW